MATNFTDEKLNRFYEETKNYRMTFDHHTHTTYSHGLGTIEENVKAAYEKGLKSIAITDHGPGHLTYGFKLEKIGEVRAEIERLKGLYPDMEILLGVEANTLRKAPYIDVPEDKRDSFDIILAGYHFGILGAGMVPNYMYSKFGMGKNNLSLLVRNTDMILNCLYNNDVAILTHPGDKGPFDIQDIAKACADTDTLIEINGKHPHLNSEEIKIAMKEDVKFVISSDAHQPEFVGAFRKQLLAALSAGLDPERIVNIERI